MDKHILTAEVGKGNSAPESKTGSENVSHLSSRFFCLIAPPNSTMDSANLNINAPPIRRSFASVCMANYEYKKSTGSRNKQIHKKRKPANSQQYPKKQQSKPYSSGPQELLCTTGTLVPQEYWDDLFECAFTALNDSAYDCVI